MQTEKQIGVPIDHADAFEHEVSDGTHDAGAPGLDWSLSDETVEFIREIELNARMARRQGASVLFG